MRKRALNKLKNTLSDCESVTSDANAVILPTCTLILTDNHSNNSMTTTRRNDIFLICTEARQGHFPSVLTMEILYEFVRIHGKKSLKWFLRIHTKFPIISHEELKLVSWKFSREVIQTHRGAQLFLSFSSCRKQTHRRRWHPKYF